MKIREFLIEDYEAAIRLWRNTEGLGLSESDSRETIHQFLLRSPGFSFVAEAENEIVGTILCGHDGRRGYIYHLAVSKPFREQGIGHQLVTYSLEKLGDCGIPKCHLFVFKENYGGMQFWLHTGWAKRDDIHAASINI